MRINTPNQKDTESEPAISREALLSYALRELSRPKSVEDKAIAVLEKLCTHFSLLTGFTYESDHTGKLTLRECVKGEVPVKVPPTVELDSDVWSVLLEQEGENILHVSNHIKSEVAMEQVFESLFGKVSVLVAGVFDKTTN